MQIEAEDIILNENLMQNNNENERLELSTAVNAWIVFILTKMISDVLLVVARPAGNTPDQNIAMIEQAKSVFNADVLILLLLKMVFELIKKIKPEHHMSINRGLFTAVTTTLAGAMIAGSEPHTNGASLRGSVVRADL